MLAIISAIAFGIALLMDWGDVNGNRAFSPPTLLLIGLILLALHLAGIGAGYDWRSRARSSRSRR